MLFLRFPTAEGQPKGVKYALIDMRYLPKNILADILHKVQTHKSYARTKGKPLGHPFSDNSVQRRKKE